MSHLTPSAVAEAKQLIGNAIGCIFDVVREVTGVTTTPTTGTRLANAESFASFVESHLDVALITVDPTVRRAHLELVRARRASATATERRAELPAGSSRARVTTANARWSRAAEYRDLCESRLEALLQSAGASS